jgi:hypothetical protein
MHGEVSFSVQIVAIRHHPQSGWLDEGPQRGPTQLSHGDLFSSDHGSSLKGGFYSIAVHDGTAEPLGVSPPETVAYHV